MARCVSLKASNDVWILPSMLKATPKDLRVLVNQARRGLSAGLKPDLVLEGSGGTYYLHDIRKNKIGVFKPADEEPYAENNPRGYLRQDVEPMSLRAGIVPGESCIRELAAFLLDRDGFSGVPMTTLVEARHPAFNTNGARLNVSQGGAAMGRHSIAAAPLPTSPLTTKMGSFQEFVRHECTIDDVSPSKISIEEVHKIAILDIRIMNADRNAANLLVRRRPDDTLELVPIDHGYCLRSVCDVCWMDWCWLDWPQIKEPLCDAHKKYIQELDVEADVRLLKEHLNLCQEAVDYFRASSALLKAGVAAGLTLYDIAILCCRNDNLAEEPSMMEKLFKMAAELAQVAVENERWHHSAASRALADQLVSRNRLGFLKEATSRRFSRSISSVEMATLPSLPSDHSLNRDEAMEPLAVLSDSDSSSDVGEDCTEWAAELIASLTEHQMSPACRTGRSMSIGSDDSSTDGTTAGLVKGFWVTAPGSVKANKSDHDSVQWTPKLSPRVPSLPLDGDLFELDLPFNSKSGKENDDEHVLKTPTVTFAATKFGFLPPATINVVGFKSTGLTKGDSVSNVLKSDGTASTGMVRSKSYSSLSGRSLSGRIGQHWMFNSPSKISTLKESFDYEQYQEYFHKFIDLVIVRETANALSNSKFAHL